MSFSYLWKEETAAHRVTYERELSASAAFGRMDKNVSGKIELSEATANIKPLFSMFDRNGDGGLDSTELAAAQTTAPRAVPAGRGAPAAAPTQAGAPAPAASAAPRTPEASNPARPQG